MREFYIRDLKSLRGVMVDVWNLVCEVIRGGPVVVTVSRESKSRSMERKYHSMIRDIAKQVRVFGRFYSEESWKALLVDKFEQELLACGEKLSHPGQTIPSMDGSRLVTVRPSTAKFRKTEGASFIEFLYQQGCEMDVAWSEPAMAVYVEYAQLRQAS
jgi:hypothetical protein